MLDHNITKTSRLRIDMSEKDRSVWRVRQDSPKEKIMNGG